MTEINLFTSFNEDILKDSGHLMLNSLSENLDSSINITAYHHDCSLTSYSIPKYTYVDMNNLESRKKFFEDFKKHDGTEDKKIAYNPSLDVLKWSNKIFALQEQLNKVNKGWLIWLDADTYLRKRLTKEDILANLNDKAHLAFLDDHPFFMAFNLNHQATKDLLKDLVSAFTSGEVLQYREWHDSFVLQRLINLYATHGLKILKLDFVKSYFTHFAGKVNPTKLSSIRDKDGKRLFDLPDTVSPDIKPNRYEQLADLIRHYKPKSILEVGTWNGGRAIEMALAAFETQDSITYYGFDLFEDANSEIDEEEFNFKAHNKVDAVIKRFTEFANKMKEKNKTFNFTVLKGNSRETLKNYNKKIDLALIGGGNSIPTVKSDYENLKHIPVVVFDHFFTKDEQDLIPPEDYQGVNVLYENLKEKRRRVLPSGDRVVGGGHTHLACVIHDEKLDDIPSKLKQVPIVVNPRDCVPKTYIRSNIRENLSLIGPDKWLGKYKLHNRSAIIVSAGPFIDMKELKDTIKKLNNPIIMCVKHSYPLLLKEAIYPWGCTVLDPRSIEGTSTHGIVRKSLFKHIHSQTKFFVASMTDPSVTKYLTHKTNNVWGWHAFTESLRDPAEQKAGIVNNQVTLNPEIGIPPGATLITGGTCAAMRTIGMLHTMGFRDMHLFGFDCCLKEEPTEEMKKETTGAEDEEPRPKYFKVGVDDKDFWTTGELLAMAQDCEKILADVTMGVNYTFHGENTLVSELWKKIEAKNTLQTFTESLK
jgi:hypothetical protein